MFTFSIHFCYFLNILSDQMSICFITNNIKVMKEGIKFFFFEKQVQTTLYFVIFLDIIVHKMYPFMKLCKYLVWTLRLLPFVFPTNGAPNVSTSLW